MGGARREEQRSGVEGNRAADVWAPTPVESSGEVLHGARFGIGGLGGGATHEC